MSKIKYSIIIPAYNEERRIVNSIKTIFSFFGKKNETCEVIISDDKSSDNTVSLVKNAMKEYGNLKLLESDKNYYKGWPVRSGILSSSGDYILMTDADLSTPIEESEKLKKSLDSGADIAIGSRIDARGHDERESQPFYRRLIGKIFTYLRKILTPEIIDSQCGFKMFKRDAALDLFKRQKITNIIFDVEILYLAKKLHYKIAQIPVKWHYSGETRMRLTIGNAFKTLLSLAQIYRLHRNEK